MILRGMPISSGIAIGKAMVATQKMDYLTHHEVEPAYLREEEERLNAAFIKASKEIMTLYEQANKRFGSEIAAVFQAHLYMLNDPTFKRDILDYIYQHKTNAEWALYQVSLKLKEKLEKVGDEYMRERALDVEDMVKHLLTALQGEKFVSLKEWKEPIILIAHDLGPSDLFRFESATLSGIATEMGSATSHTAIMAKALNIPCVMGIDHLLANIGDWDDLIIDGNEGVVIVNPDPSMVLEFKNKMETYARFIQRLKSSAGEPGVTKDETKITFHANIELLSELKHVKDFGAEGIGLYRSEFLYLSMYPQVPSEAKHKEVYLQLLKSLNPNPVTIRTFDLGGRKLARDFLHLEEDNPVLGIRGVRLCLYHREIFNPQLRALMQVALEGNLRVMLPMVSTVEEIREVKTLLRHLAEELEKEKIPYSLNFPLGIMVEVPSTAILIEPILQEVDFLSIGTNDLTQYTLAVDRHNPRLQHLNDPLQPAVIHLIAQVVEAANRHQKPVSVCGEMASHPLGVLILIGLGVRELSMEPKNIYTIKEMLGKVSIKTLHSLVKHILATHHTAQEVRETLLENLGRHLPEGLICPL